MSHLLPSASRHFKSLSQTKPLSDAKSAKAPRARRSDAPELNIPPWASGPGSFRRLSEPLRRLAVPGHAQRHRARQELHQSIYAAVALSEARDPAAKAAWRAIVQRCGQHKGHFLRQLWRCSGKHHVLERLLDAKDYDALVALAPCLLPRTHYGRVQVIRTNSSLYIGEVREPTFIIGKAQPHGFGCCVRSNGDIQQGTWENGRLSGPDSVVLRGDMRFEGRFVDGVAHGKGRLVSSGIVQETYWKNNLMDGIEIATFDRGGKVVLKRENGVVKFYDKIGPDGTHYNGQVDSEGRAHGFGKHTFSDGSDYKGSYLMGSRHGEGIWSFGCDDPLFGYRYIGQFINDQAHGRGVLENIATGAKVTCFYRQAKLLTAMPPRLNELLASGAKGCESQSLREPIAARAETTQGDAFTPDGTAPHA